MIRDQHEISRPIVRIHTAGRIGQNQLLRPHKSHQSCGQHHIRHGIPFIVMHSSLHDDHRLLFYIAECLLTKEGKQIVINRRQYEGLKQMVSEKVDLE